MLAYIKDCLDLNGKTKALLKVKSGSVSEDRLASATSSFVCHEIPTNVNNGDIFILFHKGMAIYYGTVTSINEYTIKCSQMLAYLKGTFNLSIVNHLTATYIEDEIKQVLSSYKGGSYYGSTYTDVLVQTKLNDFTLTSDDDIEGNLETDYDLKDDGTKEDKNTQKDFEKWAYELYETYGIVFDFTIPFGASNPSIRIWKPNYSFMKISKGFECISAITPTLTETTTNRVIVFYQSGDDTHTKKSYRTTLVLTTNGIVEEPSTIIGRSNTVNTKVVYSDDDIDDIKQANLSEEMYNHKIVFNVNLNNNLYSFTDLKLDLPIHIYNDGDYYETIITGKDYSFSEEVISDLKLTCGYVRTSLTKKLYTRYQR